MKTDSERLAFPLPPKSKVRPVFQIAADHVPLVKDYVKWQVMREKQSRSEELERYCSDVATRINGLCRDMDAIKDALKSKIDGNHLWSRDFFKRFSAAASEYVGEPDDHKREYLVTFVANYARDRRPDISLISMFWMFTRELSGSHLLLLKMLYDAQKSLDDVDLRNLRPDRSEAVSLKMLSDQTSIDSRMVDILIQSLVSRGLSTRVGAPFAADSSDRVLLSPAGREYLKFLCGDW